MFPKFDQILQPKIKPLISTGKLMYSDKYRSNCILALKKRIREEFDDLNKKSNLSHYQLEFYRTHTDFLNKVNEIVKNKEPIPFLLFIYKQQE